MTSRKLALRHEVYLEWCDRIGVHVKFAAACAIFALECDRDSGAQDQAVNRGIVFG